MIDHLVPSNCEILSAQRSARSRNLSGYEAVRILVTWTAERIGEKDVKSMDAKCR
jgi:hypothetical protein